MLKDASDLVQVDHELCRKCPHDHHCTEVCVAIETLVQLAKVRSPMAQLEYVYNIGTKLDLINSIDAINNIETT